MSYHFCSLDFVSGGQLVLFKIRFEQLNTVDRSFQSLERLTYFFIPDSISDFKKPPLLIAYHGAGEDGKTFRSRTTGFGYDQEAAKEGMIVAYPDGYKTHWNDFRPSNQYPPRRDGIDDVEFTRQIIKLAELQWGTSKTFLAGYSNGGHMVFTLIAKLGAKYISGAVVHCAGFPNAEHLKQSRNPYGPVPICIINGTLDPVNPYGGGRAIRKGWENAAMDLGSVLSGEETINLFRTHFSARMHRETFLDLKGIMDVTQWSFDCGRVGVRLISLIGEGHFVPFGTGPKSTLSIGPRRGAVHAPHQAMKFFKDSSLHGTL